MPFLALPSDIERVVLWRLEEEWTKEGTGKKRLEVPGVKLMVVRKERLQREDFLLRQPFPIRAARRTPLTSGLWV